MRGKVTLEVVWRETVCEEAQEKGRRRARSAGSSLYCCSELPLALAAAAAIPPFRWGSWPGCFETTAVPVERNTTH